MPKNAERSWSPWRRHTKAIVLGLLIPATYFSAVNRPQQPLLWAIAALLAATFMVGMLWPRWLVRRLAVTRAGPVRAAEGETITLRVEVCNEGWMPRFMVEVFDRLPFAGMAAGASVHSKTALGMIAYIPGNGRKSFDASVVCEKRGYYRLGPVSLASGFPLGLAEASQERRDSVQALTVYPSVFPIAELPLRGAHSQIHRGAYLLPEGAGAAEFSGMREYRRGDSPRHIHWPTTARLNELMVKEFEPLASACVCLALDLGKDSNVGQGRHASFEYAVRIAASVAGFTCNNAIPTRLAGQGRRALMLAAGTGAHHYQTILDELAVVDTDGDTPYATLLESVALDCQAGETVVVFLSEPETRGRETLQALSLLRTRGANLFAVSFDCRSFVADVAQSASSPELTGALLEFGGFHMHVAKHDDLTRLFNP
jgi:uncharacterized protein (DUF58 family)